MSRSGRHRARRSSRLTRISLMLTAGGAGIALPLTLAGGAVAAPGSPQSAAFAEQSTATDEVAEADEDGQYTVVDGDTLARIADTQNVDGGWQALYETNRDAVGDDPDLILPGLELALTGAEAPADAAESDADDGADQVALAAAEVAPEAGTDGGFTVPVDAAPSTGYGVAGALWGSGYHTGVDFSAPSGAQVSAIGPGTVVSAGWSGAYGNEVVIEHADGHYSQYAHLSSLSVSAGQQVGGGDEIGLVGSTGNSTGPHLHLEVRTGPDYGADVDPLEYLRSQGVSI